MIWLSIALVVVAYVALQGFCQWLTAKYPTSTLDAQRDAGRLDRIEDRLSTLELQRGILRNVKGTKP